MGSRVELLLRRIAEREGEQPQSGLLVHGQVCDLVDGGLDVAERLASLDQLHDLVAVVGQCGPCSGRAHGDPLSLVPKLAYHVGFSPLWSVPLSHPGSTAARFKQFPEADHFGNCG
jgi:hypothetical protein